LRPLGLGEILDRAVTLCVRNFPLLALILIVFLVPLAVIEFFMTQDQSRLFRSLADIMKHANDSSASLPAAPNALFSLWLVAYLLMLFFVMPLPIAALAVAIAAFYLGESSTFGRAYRAALDRYPNLLLYNILWIFTILVLYLAMVIVIVVATLALGAFVFALHTIGTIIAIILGSVAGIAVIAAALVFFLVYQVGFMACTLERRGFAAAYAAGFERVFAKVGLRRSIRVAFAYLAIMLGIYIVSALGQLALFGFLRSDLLGTAFSALLQLIIYAFLTAFMAIFYFDLRVREEGLDLQLAAQASSAEALPIA
jgi:hypothetical protein